NWGPIALVFGPPIAMTLGTLASALGDPGAAAGFFAAAHARVSAGPVHAAWVCFEHGCTLQGEERRQLLEKARGHAVALRLRGLVRRIDTLLGPVVTPARAPIEADDLVIEPQGADWVVRRGARQVLVPNMKGMPMLAELIAHPHREIHAVELVGEGEG